MKPANKKFSRLPNEYELTLNTDAEVIPVDDDSGIESTRFDFVPIEAIQKIEPNEFVDVIGVLVGVQPLTNITSKAGQELRKRALTLVDKTLCQVEVTLWGDQAEKYDEVTLGAYSVVAIKACKVSDFGGRSLSSSFQSQLFLNPDHAEAHQLRAWYDANGASLTDLQNISKQARGGDGGGGPGANQRKYLSDIKDEGLGMKDKPDFFVTRGTITFFKHDFEKGSMPWYNACPQPNCNKKVTEEAGAWHCDKCNRNYPAPSPRFILSLMVCDATGSTWLTAFNDAAQGLLNGTTAEQLNQLVLSDQKEAGTELTAHSCHETKRCLVVAALARSRWPSLPAAHTLFASSFFAPLSVSQLPPASRRTTSRSTCSRSAPRPRWATTRSSECARTCSRPRPSTTCRSQTTCSTRSQSMTNQVVS